jgi:hypothetical protein
LTPKQIDHSRIESNEWPEFDKHDHISPAQKARIPPIAKQRRPQKESNPAPAKAQYHRSDSNGYNGDLEGFDDSGDFQGHAMPVESNSKQPRRAVKKSGNDQRFADMNSDDGEDSTDKLGNFGAPGFGGRLRKDPSPVVYPENSVPQAKNTGIRAGGGLSGIGDLGVVGQNRVVRQGRGRGQPLQSEARWMDGGANGDSESTSVVKGGNHQPHSPRGSGGGSGSFGRERQFKGAYENKFDRDNKMDSKYDDVEIDDMSEANDDNSVHSDFSNDLSPTAARKGRKQRNQALGKLKRRMKNGAESKNVGIDGDMRSNPPHKGR